MPMCLWRSRLVAYSQDWAQLYHSRHHVWVGIDGNGKCSRQQLCKLSCGSWLWVDFPEITLLFGYTNWFIICSTGRLWSPFCGDPDLLPYHILHSRRAWYGKWAFRICPLGSSWCTSISSGLLPFTRAMHSLVPSQVLLVMGFSNSNHPSKDGRFSSCRYLYSISFGTPVLILEQYRGGLYCGLFHHHFFPSTH